MPISVLSLSKLLIQALTQITVAQLPYLKSCKEEQVKCLGGIYPEEFLALSAPWLTIRSVLM